MIWHCDNLYEDINSQFKVYNVPLLDKMVKHTKKRFSDKHKLLTTSWMFQGKLYCEQSTLHGVRYIGESDRPFIER